MEEAKTEKEGLSLRKNMLYNTIGSSVYLGLQWLITILVVIISGYDDAGILSLAMSISNVIFALASFSMRGYQSSDVEGKFDNYTYVFSRYITCIVSLIICFIFLIFTQYNLFIKASIFIYIIFKISEALVDVFHGAEQKKWRMDIVGISYFIRGIAAFVAFVGALLLTKNILIAISAMAISVYIVIIAFDVPKFKKIIEIKRNIDFRKILKLLYICLPLTIYGFSLNGIQAYPRYFLEQVTSQEILGIYSSIATPVIIIQVASAFIFNPLITWFAELYKEKKKKEFYLLIVKVTIAIILIGIVFLIGASIFGDFALKTLYGENILEYSYLLNLIIVTTVLYTIVAFFNTVLTVVRDFANLLIGNIMGLIISVILSNIFISQYQIDGINTALIATFSIQILYLLIAGGIRLNIKFNKKGE